MRKDGTRPRVLVIGPISPPVGGMATFVENYLNSSMTTSFKITFVPLDLVGKYARKGVRRSLLNAINVPCLSWRVLVQAFRTRPDIVHVHANSYLGFYEKAFAGLLAKLTGAKLVLHIHGGAFKSFYEASSGFARKLILGCLAASDRIVTPSESMSNSIREMGVAAEKLCCIPNGVFLPANTTWDRYGEGGRQCSEDEKRVRVLFLNRLEVRKGIHELAKAAEIVTSKYRDVEFLFVGPQTEASRELAIGVERRGLSTRIRIQGPVFGVREKAEIFLNSEVYVLPSYSENLPFGLLEAAAYGLACIATPVGGIREVISDGEDGLLVPVGDVQALVSAIERCLVSLDFRKTMGMKIRRKMEERFSFQKTVDRMTDLYFDLV